MTVDEKKEYDRLYYLKNKDKIKASVLKWRENNPDKVKGLAKKWKLDNPDKVKASSKKWKKNNPDKVSAYRDDWRSRNPEKLREYCVDWRSKNKLWVKSYNSNYSKNRMLNGLCTCCGAKKDDESVRLCVNCKDTKAYLDTEKRQRRLILN